MTHSARDVVPDYLLLGHVAHDITPVGPQLGGTVSYGAHTAAAFGLRVGILTSTKANELLLERLPPGVLVHNVTASCTTTFENRYTGTVRIQFMYHRARTLTPDQLPPAWRKARLVHFAPIAYEVDPAFATIFEGGRICITPQGWLRAREADGRVRAVAWDNAADVLPYGTVAVISEEDIQHDPKLESTFARLAPLLIVTQAERGGKIYRQGRASHFDAHTVPGVHDPTGAGDIFATAFHIVLDRLGDIDSALRAAAYIAGQSVTRAGFASAPTPEEVRQAWRIAAAP